NARLIRSPTASLVFETPSSSCSSSVSTPSSGSNSASWDVRFQFRMSQNRQEFVSSFEGRGCANVDHTFASTSDRALWLFWGSGGAHVFRSDVRGPCSRGVNQAPLWIIGARTLARQLLRSAGARLRKTFEALGTYGKHAAHRAGTWRRIRAWHCPRGRSEGFPTSRDSPPLRDRSERRVDCCGCICQRHRCRRNRPRQLFDAVSRRRGLAHLPHGIHGKRPDETLPVRSSQGAPL